jgi:diaminopimelate epimerase
MNIPFTKMQGAGNDFVVLDETQGRLNLSRAQYQRLADRHFGVGADQILTVRAASTPDVDFDYVIHNADGGEVEHCGNGARCFVRFVRERGLTTKTEIKVRTQNRVLTLTDRGGLLVEVDMGKPVFEAALIPYVAPSTNVKTPWDFVVSMGNPHAVLVMDGADELSLVNIEIPAQRIQADPAFPQGVNVGFMQIIDRKNIKLRVYERGSGETLACGTGACAAVVAGIELGLLDTRVLVETNGGELTIGWKETATFSPIEHTVLLTGPAKTVYQGTIEL